ncbi:MAG: MoaD/ThiS family protein [Ilumatobacteraceae bacterium]
MKVRIPTPLRSYTSNAANVMAEGATLTELLVDLDRQFPGIMFRVVDEQGELRQHMVIWLNDERCRDLATRIDDVEEVVIMQALSGG